MGISWLDVKLGLRMLFRYKGLSLAGGLALAIAIGLGAGWYDVMRDQLHPRLPLPDGDRLVEVELRNAATSAGELRVLHDFLNWRRDVRTIEELGASRTLERNLILGDARPEQVASRRSRRRRSGSCACRRSSAVRCSMPTNSPERPPVVVLGYSVWQRRFGGRADAIGQTLQLGRAQPTVVGVMPEGFAFPENHKLWVPLQLRPSGYAPLEGLAVQVFGRLAPGMQPPQARAEIAALTARAAGDVTGNAPASPSARLRRTAREDPRRRIVDRFRHHARADSPRPDRGVRERRDARVRAHGDARGGDRRAARARREPRADRRSAVRRSARARGHRHGRRPGRRGPRAAVGVRLPWPGPGLPFWIQPGLKFTTVIYAALLAVAAAGILGVLPALKATGSRSRRSSRTWAPAVPRCDSARCGRPR